MISDSERHPLAGRGLEQKVHLSALKLQLMFSVLTKTGPTATATASRENRLFVDLTEAATTELPGVVRSEALLPALNGALAG